MTLTSMTRLTLSKPTFKGKDMKDIFESVIAQAPADWDNDLMSLSDELKDLAVFSWFQAKPSWIEDFLPEALHDLKKTWIRVLYEDTENFEKIINYWRDVYSVKHDITVEGNEDVFNHCAALGDFQTVCANAVDFISNERIIFGDMYKELIYLELEATLRDKLFEAQGLEESHGCDVI